MCMYTITLGWLVEVFTATHNHTNTTQHDKTQHTGRHRHTQTHTHTPPERPRTGQHAGKTHARAVYKCVSQQLRIPRRTCCGGIGICIDSVNDGRVIADEAWDMASACECTYGNIYLTCTLHIAYSVCMSCMYACIMRRRAFCINVCVCRRVKCMSHAYAHAQTYVCMLLRTLHICVCSVCYATLGISACPHVCVCLLHCVGTRARTFVAHRPQLRIVAGIPGRTKTVPGRETPARGYVRAYSGTHAREVHINIHTNIHTHTSIHPYIHPYMHTYIHSYIHTYITYIHTYRQTDIHTCIQTHIPIHTYIHTYMHTSMHTYMHTHIHTNKHTYINTHAYT